MAKLVKKALAVATLSIYIYYGVAYAEPKDSLQKLSDAVIIAVKNEKIELSTVPLADEEMRNSSHLFKRNIPNLGIKSLHSKRTY